MKKRIAAGIMLTSAFSLAIAAQPGKKSEARRWYSGRVISASLTGYGSRPNDPKRRPRNDIWWTYCVSGEDQSHTAVSRTNPSKAHLTVNSLIRFYTDKDRLYVLNHRGERYTLRRLSQGNQAGCR